MAFKKTRPDDTANSHATTHDFDPIFSSDDSIHDDVLKGFGQPEDVTGETTIQVGYVIQVDECGEPLKGVAIQPVGMVFQTVSGGELIIHADGSYEYHAPTTWYLDENNDEEMAESFKYSVHDLQGRLLEESILTIRMTEEGPIAYNDYEDMDFAFDEENEDVQAQQPVQGELPAVYTENRVRQKLIRSVIYEGKIYSLSADHTYVLVDGASYSHFNGHTLFLDTAVGGQFQVDLIGDKVGEYLYTAPIDFHKKMTIYADNMENFPVTEKAGEMTQKFTFTLAPGIDASSASVVLTANNPEITEASGYWYIYRDGELLMQKSFTAKFHDGLAQLEFASPQAIPMFDQLILLSSEAREKDGQNQPNHFQVQSATFDLDGNVREQVGYILENEDGTRLSSVLTFKMQEDKEGPIVAVADEPVLNEDQMVTIQVTDKPTSAGETLPVMLASPPTHGLVRVNADHTVTYIPHLNYLGADNFEYQTIDAQSNIQVSRSYLAINPANAVAVAVDNQYITWMNQDLIISPQLLLEQNEESDLCTQRIHSYTQPAHGLLMVQEDETLLYRPHKNFVGDDHFSYSVLNTLTNDVLDTKQVMIQVQKSS